MNAQQHVDVFNEDFPVGTPVQFKTRDGQLIVYTTVSKPAFLDAKGKPMAVLVSSRNGAIGTDFLIPLARVSAA